MGSMDEGRLEWREKFEERMEENGGELFLN